MIPQILIALANKEARQVLAAQLDADGYVVMEASTSANALAMLQRPISLVLLGDLERPAAAVHLLRELRDAKLDLAVDPRLPVMTIGAGDELTQLRAYEAGSDHHIASTTNYILLRAIIAAVVRRTTVGKAKARQLNVGPLHIDTGTYEVTVNGEHVHVPKREFELLATLAAEPTRVFTKAELNEALWGYAGDSRSRTVESHACRLRRRLAEHGQTMIISRWGVGYKLIGPS